MKRQIVTGSVCLTLLHWAAHVDGTEVAGLLLKRGMDVNASLQRMETPLHVAAKRGHLAMVRFLLEHGAQVNARYAAGTTDAGGVLWHTPHDVATEQQRLVSPNDMKKVANFKAIIMTLESKGGAAAEVQ